MDAENLYRQLGRLLSQAPNLWQAKYLDQDGHLWLGRVGAIVEAVGDISDKSAFRSSTQNLVGLLRETSIQSILAIANRTLATLELSVPTAAQGSFVAPGAMFDMHRAMAEVLGRAARDVLVVDPYIDEVFLTKYGLLAPKGTTLRLLGAAKNKECGQRLLQAQAAWQQQHAAERPLECRRATGAVLHNRHFILDGGAEVWDSGQSVRNFVEHSANSLQRLEKEIAAETAAFYDSAWQAAIPLA